MPHALGRSFAGTRRRTLWAVTAAVSVAVLSACSSSTSSAGAGAGGTTTAASTTTPADTSSASGGTSASSSAGGALDTSLKGICPDTVAVQMDWEPEAEHAGVYELVGPGYTVDTARKRVTGPLTVGGTDTGVKIEVRAGGAAIGFAPVTAQMYVDKTITLGSVSTDAAVATSAKQPVTAVVSPLNLSPQMLMWDPASHPTWTGIKDMKASGVKVVVNKGANYIALLEGKGLVDASQIDTGYTGSPNRFVSDPKIVQQGFATAEPYIYQHEVKTWGKPVKYELLADVGYTIYPEALSVRTADLATMAPCLKKLVPILQQAQLDYIKDPSAANKLIVDVVGKYNDGWVYSAGVADFAASSMKSIGIVKDDTSGVFGGMDMTRVQSVIDTFAPGLKSGGAAVKDGLKAADIATSEFLDPSIKMG
ncbi:MAG: hypothetical protein QOI42_88 [Frankiaceae bacterium]|nr:hypothetical protein [Frankiaceae bacterium]